MTIYTHNIQWLNSNSNGILPINSPCVSFTLVNKTTREPLDGHSITKHGANGEDLDLSSDLQTVRHLGTVSVTVSNTYPALASQMAHATLKGLYIYTPPLVLLKQNNSLPQPLSRLIDYILICLLPMRCVRRCVSSVTPLGRVLAYRQQLSRPSISRMITRANSFYHLYNLLWVLPKYTPDYIDSPSYPNASPTPQRMVNFNNIT